MHRPTLHQLVCMRDWLASARTMDNVKFQDNGDISFIYINKLHKIDMDGNVHVSEWHFLMNRHSLKMEA